MCCVCQLEHHLAAALGGAFGLLPRSLSVSRIGSITLPLRSFGDKLQNVRSCVVQRGDLADLMAEGATLTRSKDVADDFSVNAELETYGVCGRCVSGSATV